MYLPHVLTVSAQDSTPSFKRDLDRSIGRKGLIEPNAKFTSRPIADHVMHTDNVVHVLSQRFGKPLRMTSVYHNTLRIFGQPNKSDHRVPIDGNSVTQLIFRVQAAISFAVTRKMYNSWRVSDHILAYIPDSDRERRHQLKAIAKFAIS